MEFWVPATYPLHFLGVKRFGVLGRSVELASPQPPRGFLENEANFLFASAKLADQVAQGRGLNTLEGRY